MLASYSEASAVRKAAAQVMCALRAYHNWILFGAEVVTLSL